MKLRVAVELKGRFLWGPVDWWSGGAEVSTLVARDLDVCNYGCSLDQQIAKIQAEIVVSRQKIILDVASSTVGLFRLFASFSSNFPNRRSFTTIPAGVKIT